MAAAEVTRRMLDNITQHKYYHGLRNRSTMDRAQHPYEALITAFALMRIPRDLLICELWLLCALLTIYLPYLNESFLRVLFGVPLILFIPGYALIAALFTAARDLDGTERVALSFGLSIAIAPLIGLILNFTPWGIRLDPVVTFLSIFTLGLCLVAQYRRARLLPEERFSVPFGELQQAVSDEFFKNGGRSRTDRILSIILLIAIIAAVLTTVYVIVVPKEGETFTEFFILGGKQMASDYPTLLMTGVNSSVFIGIGNHEYRTVDYTVETYFVNMSFDSTTNETTMDFIERIDRFPVSVRDNQTVVMPYSFTPVTSSFNRIEFLLFNETVPDDGVTGMDRINRSYRNLHLWVKVHDMSLTGF